MIAVIARFKAATGREGQLRDVLAACVEPTRMEPGCHSYILHQSLDDPGLFMFYETWSDRAALDAHMRTPHLKALVAGATPLLEGCAVVSVLQALP